MKRWNVMCAGIAALGVAAASLGYAAPGKDAAPMDCDKMMRDHIGMMGKGGGMMGKDHGGMMGKDHMGMMGKGMPPECMEMMEKHGMSMGKPANDSAAPTAHRGVGIVQSVDPGAGTVTLQHEAIESLGWPAMTMPFVVQDKSVLERLKPGQRVDFAFLKQGTRYLITSVN